MRTDPRPNSCFDDELAALIAGDRSRGDEEGRHALFAALSTLERRALIAGASDSTLRKIAEIRFLAGILRDAMRPTRIAPLRSLLRTVRCVEADLLPV